jgi:hypothetical protein
MIQARSLYRTTETGEKKGRRLRLKRKLLWNPDFGNY